MFYELAKESFDSEHLQLLEELSERTGIPCEELIKQILFESEERKQDIVKHGAEIAGFKAFIDSI